MTTARRLFIADHRSQILERRVQAWLRADSIRAYCAAVEERFGGELEASQEALDWLRLARAEAERLQQLPRMPPDPEVRADDLKPYLGRWSPYGPDQRRW